MDRPRGMLRAHAFTGSTMHPSFIHPLIVVRFCRGSVIAVKEGPTEEDRPVDMLG